MGQLQPLFCELRCKGMEKISKTKQKTRFFMLGNKILYDSAIIFLFLSHDWKNETSIIFYIAFVCDAGYRRTI